jgi:hypothetical protein
MASPYGYSGQNSSSIYATTDATATSGGQFVLGGNPNLALLFPGGNVGGGLTGGTWGPLLIGAAAVALLLLLRRKRS